MYQPLAPIMKKIAIIIILTLFSVILSAHTKNDEINKLIISYNGDSTLLTEKYEIDIKKEKIYYITPIMNYLDVKGEKYRTAIKIKKRNWETITPLIKSLYNLTNSQNSLERNRKIIYSIEFLKDNKEIERHQFYTEQVPDEVKKLFEIIRNKK